jgi:UDP-3-O-[3-hydroxymyristoyl] glucosamine N-acyltransferase
MSNPLLFLGTCANIIRYKDAAERQGLTVAGILDSDWFQNTQDFCGIPIIDTEANISNYKDTHDFFIATNWTIDPNHVRDKEKRKMLIDLVREQGIECINIIDPSSYIGTGTQIGQGVYIAFCAMIEPGTVLKDFCQVHDFVGLAHGTRVGENTIIQRQAGLHADIGDDVYIGMWSKAYHPRLLKIGNNAVINPGLYVARDVAEGETIRLTKESIRVYQHGIKIE